MPRDVAMQTMLAKWLDGPCWRVLLAWLPLAATACATLPEAPIPAPTVTRSALVVFDIDGTLTPHNLLVHEARPDAAHVVQAFESRGYAIVYLTARAPAFQRSLPGWLQEHGFPPGNLHAAQSLDDRRHAEYFKSRVLDAYVAQGWHLAYAFGDSSTDFIAYQRAGLPRERVFALKRKGRDACDEGVYQACLGDWEDDLPSAVADPPWAGSPDSQRSTSP